MTWLERLQDLEKRPESEVPKGAKGTSDTFGTADVGHVQEIHAPDPAPSANLPKVSQPDTAGMPNDPEFSPDRWCWPHSDAMTGAEIDLMQSRLALFAQRGLRVTEADRLVDTLVKRDREGDDRRCCFECANLRGRQCAVPDLAGAGQNVAPFVLMLQRCPGFKVAT